MVYSIWIIIIYLSLEMFLSSIYKQELLSRQNNQEFLDIRKALDCKSSNFPSSILVSLLVAPLDVKQPYPVFRFTTYLLLRSQKE